MKTLDGKVAVVTGAASGIGRAVAVELAGHGARLAISDVDEGGLAETERLAASAGAREIRSDRLDVADRAAFAAYASSVAGQHGRVDLVVNNAGVAVTGQVADVSYEDIEWIMAVNFWGVVHGTKEFLPHLVASGDGHLVNLSSLFGLMATPGQGAYNATKYAVRGLTEALRQELLIAGHPVGVTAVHPGGVRTAIARSSRYTPAADREATVRLFDERLARTSPERAAQRIVRAVIRNQPRVLIGTDAHLLHPVVVALGARYQDLFARVARRTMLRTGIVR